ncbi:DUF2735 domain-containing protein [Methyloligella solikamskensis]|uniref:DUF2735 domain-containing protein n=1 Tax=Methyloligella solikamskensis TaxID=1177756 RepID=A0ABW3J7E0_9HYPH
MNAFRESAEIIQFPAGGRAGFERRERRAAVEQGYTAHVEMASGGAWYHEEAIREANRANNS